VAGATREMTVAARGIGIDVGASSVKVAVVRRRFGRLVLERVTEQPIARERGGRPPAEAVSEAVAAAIEGVKVGHAVVVAGVPTQLATVRNLDLPFERESRIRQVVKVEVESHLPFVAEEIVVDYSLTGIEREAAPAEQGETPPPVTNVLITAVQKKVVGDLLGVVRTEALDPEVVDVEFMGAFSAVRALAPWTSTGGELVVDLGAVKTSVIYARQGRPLAVRAFNVGGDTLTQALATATSVSFVEAEQAKRSLAKPAEGEDATDPAARALAETLTALRRGLDQTIRFFASQVGEVEYDRVVLTGGSAALSGLKEWFASVLSKEVVVLDSLGPVRNAAREEVCVARQATAIGLALRGVGESVTLHNFRQEELGYPNLLKRFVKYLVPAAALLVCIVAAAGLSYYLSYRSTREEARCYREETAKQIRAVLGAGVAYPKLDDLKREVEKRSAELESLSGENPKSVLDVLYELSNICYAGKAPPDPATQPKDPDDALKALIERAGPWKVQITSFKMGRGRVEIEGSAASYNATTQIERALKASPLFKGVRRHSSKRLPDGRQTLRMTIFLK